jgi:hypothetical protein
MLKISMWGAAIVLVVSLLVTVYWIVEPDSWVEPNKVAVVSQKEGDSVAVDVPVENYARAFKEFSFRTRVTTRYGTVIKETEPVAYEPNMKYKFVTYSQLSVGSYEADLIVGYQLNPLSYRELYFPLAIIYVEKK